MKKQLIIVSLLSSLLLFGCTSKAPSVNTASKTANNSIAATKAAANTTTVLKNGQTSQPSTDSQSNIEVQRTEVKTDFKPVQSNTISKLTPRQRSQIDSKVIATLKKIDTTLNSLQDAPDVNVN